MAQVTKIEALFHTPEQVQELTDAAVRIADTLLLTDADRAALLPAILGALALKAVSFVSEQSVPAMAIPRGLR